MATRLTLDPALIDRAVAVSGGRSKKAAVTVALKEFIACREQGRIAELLGQLEWDAGFDPKVERSRRCAFRRHRHVGRDPPSNHVTVAEIR